MSYDIKIQ